MFLNLSIFLQSLDIAAVKLKRAVARDFQKFYSSAPYTVAKIDHFASNRNDFFYIEAKRTSLLKKNIFIKTLRNVYKVKTFFRSEAILYNRKNIFIKAKRTD